LWFNGNAKSKHLYTSGHHSPSFQCRARSGDKCKIFHFNQRECECATRANERLAVWVAGCTQPPPPPPLLTANLSSSLIELQKCPIIMTRPPLQYAETDNGREKSFRMGKEDLRQKIIYMFRWMQQNPPLFSLPFREDTIGLFSSSSSSSSSLSPPNAGIGSVLKMPWTDILLASSLRDPPICRNIGWAQDCQMVECKTLINRLLNLFYARRETVASCCINVLKS
jgi:hypothetical protein